MEHTSDFQPMDGCDAPAVDPLMAFLEDFRLQQLTLSEADNMPPWSLDVGQSDGLCCYMLSGSPARAVVGQHFDEVIYPGDLLIVLDGAAHSLQSVGDSGPTRLRASRQQYDRDRIAPLLKLLPPALVNRGMGGKPSAELSPVIAMFEMTGSPVRMIDMGLVVRLGELAFMHTVRRHIDQTVPPEQRRLMGRDLFNVVPALVAMRQDLKRDWTLKDISREAAVSKSRLAEIFSRTLKQSPKRYLTSLRMLEASGLLQQGVLSIAQIAHQVGYQSVAPFNRAFKRWFGVPPGAYRLEARRPAPPPAAAPSTLPRANDGRTTTAHPS